MKIGVISDTHGSIDAVKKAFEIFGSHCTKIIHGGDVLYHGPRNPLPAGYNPKEVAEFLNSKNNIIFAKGNCDSDVDQMVISHPIMTPYLFFEVDGKKFLVNHGYTEPKESIISRAKEFNTDFLIFGHTHVKELYKTDNLIVINPGSPSLPKDGSASVAIIDDTCIKLINIDTNEVISELNI